jgi:hypothetical protein
VDPDLKEYPDTGTAELWVCDDEDTLDNFANYLEWLVETSVLIAQ